MHHLRPPLTLASASPRRRELLARLDWPFTVIPAAIDEALEPGRDLHDAVAALAARKARAVANTVASGFVLGSDTLVTLDGAVLVKPVDAADARRMLGLLSGRDHDVITGVALVDAATGDCRQTAVVSTVTFRPISAAEIAAYVATGEPDDKAGAYAIQGAGGRLISSIRGCYLAIVGLPLCAVAELLGGAGWPVVTDDPVCTLPSGAPCPRLTVPAI